MPRAKSTYDERGEATRDRIAASIKQWQQQRGYSPSIRELADELDLSTTRVNIHINKMEEQGRLVREGPRTTRGYQLVVHW